MSGEGIIIIISAVDLKWCHSLLSEINRTADSIVIGNRGDVSARITVSLLFVIMTSMSVLDLGVIRVGFLLVDTGLAYLILF